MTRRYATDSDAGPVRHVAFGRTTTASRPATAAAPATATPHRTPAARPGASLADPPARAVAAPTPRSTVRTAAEWTARRVGPPGESAFLQRSGRLAVIKMALAPCQSLATHAMLAEQRAKQFGNYG